MPATLVWMPLCFPQSPKSCPVSTPRSLQLAQCPASNDLRLLWNTIIPALEWWDGPGRISLNSGRGNVIVSISLTGILLLSGGVRTPCISPCPSQSGSALLWMGLLRSSHLLLSILALPSACRFPHCPMGSWFSRQSQKLFCVKKYISKCVRY